MNDIILLFIVPSLLIYGSIFLTHALRDKITIAPFYVLLGALVWIMWWVTDAGLRIEVLGLSFLIGSTVYYSAIISSIFIVYLFDGPQVTRRSITIVICVACVVPITNLVIHYHSLFDSGSSLAVVPIPELRVNVASIFATIIDLSLLVYCWNYLSRETFRIPLWLRSFGTLLLIMWCDVILFGAGAFCGTELYWMYTKNTAISRLATLLIIFPVIWQYIKWQNSKNETRIHANSPREIFRNIMDVERELKITKKELKDHKTVESLIRQSEHRYRNLFENAPIALWEEDFSDVKEYCNTLQASGIHDLREYLNDKPDILMLLASKTRILDVNQEAVALHGARNKSELKENLAKLFSDESLITFKEVILAVAEEHLPFKAESEVRRLDGEKRHIIIRVGLSEPSGQDYSRILLSTENITKRKQAEEELRYRSTIETAIAKISSLFVIEGKVDYNEILRLLGESILANRAYIFKVHGNENTASNSFEWCSPATSPQIEYLQKQELSMFPWWMKKLRNGKNVVITHLDLLPAEAFAEKEILEAQQIKSLISVPIWSKGKKLWGFMGLDDTENTRRWSETEIEALQVAGEMISGDIERRTSLEKLSIERKQLLSIFDSIDQFIYISDPYTNEILYVNRALKETLKKDPTGGLCYQELQNSDTPCSFCTNETILQQNPTPHRCEFYNHKFNKTLDIVDRIIQWPDGRDVRFELAIDISTRKVLEQQLQQAGKMQAIGTLAGGIAHDFNNILAAMLGYTELAKEDCLPGSTVERDLSKVMEAGNRAKNLVQRILAFSRQDITKRILLQPAVIVTEAVKILRPSIPTTIEILQNITLETGLISADPTQFHQILINLCTNAFQAMEETGGTLEITLKEVVLGGKDLEQEPDIEGGSFVQLSVCDSGPGIENDIKKRIFEPYFTTKETGKGTGMGLSIVHGIVKSYGGFVQCFSEVGKGAIFDVYFPVVEGEMPVETVEGDELCTGKERILFIDDEKLLAEMGKVMLERLGYQVTVSKSSLDALETFRRQPEQFDLVITDQTMPHMTGAEMASKMIEIRAEIPVILCTGYSSIISEEDAKSIGIKAFALKPLLKSDLSKLVQKVLHE